ncbi:hypothetical protein [Marisediminicola senii]|uniref:hypothetical protein n=1 Tax=Marisediminicola senii TaxID=2711233 RepID=UPI0013EDFFAB|nr:hypothetical protein [Marisediminicola senii]
MEYTEQTEQTDAPAGTDAFLSRLRVIEEQPLDSRASAFAAVHDELRSALESGDASRQD